MCPICAGRDARPVGLAGRRSGSRPYIQQRIAAGDTKSQIKDELVAQFGPADPGRAAAARVRPARVAAAARRDRGWRRRCSALLAWRWTRVREPEPAPQRWSLNGHPLGPERGAPARRGARSLRWRERIAGAFAAGLVSIALPCVLPLVPGYLSAISAVEVDRLGERGVARRVVARERALRARLHRRLRRARRRRGGARRLGRPGDAGRRSPASCSSCSGLAFVGLLPWPERMLAPGALDRRAGERLARAARRARSPSAPRRASASCSARSSCSPADSRTVVRGVRPARRVLARDHGRVRR